ncbi:hypothetical protein [Flavobacterium sp.]|uniref:hypothetical protein n=1 Tax=Flavobacterium sp. TaxID=239 RepID=UPI00286E0F47|nr:hypothetical protein [Flavobacterium sp.]
MENTNPLNVDPIQEWVNSDKELSKILVEIQEMSISIEEQAEVAFHRISEMYKLPKLPDDISDDQVGKDEEEPTSVYEQLGLLKYLNPNDDIRGLVLLAIYSVKEGFGADVSSIVSEMFTDDSDNTGIGHIGENSNVEIIIVKKG